MVQWFKRKMSYTPWINIEYDNKTGFATVVVEDEHLQDFPKFMKAVLQQNIGRDVGFFKIRFSDGVKYTTGLQELTKFIHNYYSTLNSRKRKKKSGYGIDNQMFFRGGSERLELFGYQTTRPTVETINTIRAKEQFVSNVSDCQSFVNQSTCCMLSLESGENKLVEHYWEVIRNFSYRSPVKSENIQKLMYHASTVRHKYVCNELSGSEESNGPDEKLLLYGAGIPMKNVDFPVTSKFNLSKLETIPEQYPAEIPGVTYPYLYVGSTHASFPWHIEDQALFSINMLHFGAPCVWFVVPPKFYRKFVYILHFMLLPKAQVTCHNILGHKYVMASEKCLQQLGIPVTRIIQKEKEIVVLFPYAAHSGFKLGFNIQEAVNFADEWWIEPGLFAPTCDCFPDEKVQMDMREIIAVARPNLLRLYIEHDIVGLMEAVHKNPFIKELDILPASDMFVPKEDETTASTSSILQLKTSEPKLASSNASLPHMRKIVDPQRVPGCRPVLICPHEGCNKSYKGGNGKVERLVTHINRRHSRCSECIQSVEQKYPKRVVSDVKRVSCHVCGKLLAGSSTNLKDHLKRVHNQ